MTKTWLGATLLLAVTLIGGGSAGILLLQSPGQLPGTTVPVIPSPIPSQTTTQAGKACPSACSAQLTATEGKIAELQAEIEQIRDALNHDVPILNDRTLDLNDRLKKLETEGEREDLDNPGVPVASL